MTIRELLNLGIKKLALSTSPELDAEVLLSHVLDKSKEYLLTNPDKKINPKLEKQFKILLERRAVGWPVAYLNNQKEFLGHKFYVDKNVLIPRPETEELVEYILQYILRYIPKKTLKILDIGTGSGNIITSLAKSLSKTHQYFASDISGRALVVAKKNAKAHKVKINFKQGSLFTPWKKQSFDIIVANLPYLAKETDSSTKFEPKNALIAKNNGLALFEELFKQANSLLPIPYCLFLEIGPDQGSTIKKLANKLLPGYETKIFKDLFGRQRFVSLVKK